MESGVIPNENIKTSSAWSANEDEKFSRLNTKEARHTAGSWVSLKNQIGEWLEINLENPAIVTDLATQGRNGRHVQWVTKYKLEYFDIPTNNPVFYQEGKKEVKVKTRFFNIYFYTGFSEILNKLFYSDLVRFQTARVNQKWVMSKYCCEFDCDFEIYAECMDASKEKKKSKLLWCFWCKCRLNKVR